MRAKEGGTYSRIRSPRSFYTSLLHAEPFRWIEAVAVAGDHIVTAGPEVDGTAAATLNFFDDLLLLGPVNTHANPVCCDSCYGVYSDVVFCRVALPLSCRKAMSGYAIWWRIATK